MSGICLLQTYVICQVQTQGNGQCIRGVRWKHTMTHDYCPGMGLRRLVIAFLQGAIPEFVQFFFLELV